MVVGSKGERLVYLSGGGVNETVVMLTPSRCMIGNRYCSVTCAGHSAEDSHELWNLEESGGLQRHHPFAEVLEPSFSAATLCSNSR